MTEPVILFCSRKLDLPRRRASTVNRQASFYFGLPACYRRRAGDLFNRRSINSRILLYHSRPTASWARGGRRGDRRAEAGETCLFIVVELPTGYAMQPGLAVPAVGRRAGKTTERISFVLCGP